MKVIALRGPEDTGKSHTINIEYQYLLREGYIQVPGIFRELGNIIYEDFIDILEKEGILVGFVGMGDYKASEGVGSLDFLLQELQQHGCHIAICACRNNPAIEVAVTNYPNHVFIDKTPSSGPANNRIVNGIDAQRIYSFI